MTPHSAGTLAFVLANVEGIVLVKYFFGDRSESVASHFASFKIRLANNSLIGTKVPTSESLVRNRVDELVWTTGSLATEKLTISDELEASEWANEVDVGLAVGT